MTRCHALTAIALALLIAGTAAADTKIVQAVHQDAFTVMGQSQPETDTERVIWLDADRLRVDEAGSTIIVRLDTDTMYMIDHGDTSVSTIELPVDLAALLPPGVAEQMRAMMQLEIAVEPTDETKKVGDWTARRWNVTMTTPMVTIENTLWATGDLDIDRTAYDRLFHQIVSLQPGTEGLVEKLRTVEGFVVEQRSVTTMTGASDTTMTRSERTVTVESADPPAGTYDPPGDYTPRELDLMRMMGG
jgi:hypothetical protein